MSKMTKYLDSSFALDICVLSSGCLSPHEDSRGDFDPLGPWYTDTAWQPLPESPLSDSHILAAGIFYKNQKTRKYCLGGGGVLNIKIRLIMRWGIYCLLLLSQKCWPIVKGKSRTSFHYIFTKESEKKGDEICRYHLLSLITQQRLHVSDYLPTNSSTNTSTPL